MYVRPIREDELVKWLMNRNLVATKEEAERLSQELVEEFDMVTEFRNP